MENPLAKVAIVTAAETLVDVATGGGWWKTALMTLLDVKNKYEESNTPYTTVQISPNSLVVQWTAKRSIRYWYVRTNGSGKDHILVCAADSYVGNFLLSTTLLSYDAEGRVYSEIITKTMNDVTINSQGFSEMTRACDAYRNAFTTNHMTVYEVGELVFTFMGNSVVAPSLALPVSPARLENS